MKTLLLIAGALAAAGLFAQEPETRIGMGFQQFTVMSDAVGGPAVYRAFGPEINGQPITGKPFSATEEHHSVQTLADGTHIENTQTNAYYRDDQGRTRNEFGPKGATHVMIHDPIAGFSVDLDSFSKTAHKLGVQGPRGAMIMPAPQPLPATKLAAQLPDVPVMSSGAGQVGRLAVIKHDEMVGETSKEDLGSQMINGVMAQGTRTTMTIPVGKIGNDRPIQVVNERWYSSDLQMLIKSSNKDPRFGETTYELTNIDRTQPAAALFQVPSDYTLQEGNEWFKAEPRP